MTLLHPFALSALIVIPLAIIFLIWRNQVRKSAIRRFGNESLLQSLISQVSPLRRQIKSTLWLLAVASLIFALARPVWGVTAEILDVEGIAILFVIDISRSMDAQDIAPSRLERAKLDIEKITMALQGNDFGYVVFAGLPFVYMPLTYDDHSIQTFLSSISSRATTNQGTNLFPAIDLGVETLTNYSAAQKLIIVMSDGENHELTNLSGLDLAKQDGIIIHTIGYGTESGSTIPLYGADGSISGYQADSNGALVTTVLQPQVLKDIAGQTGGFYYTDEGINNLIETLQASETGDLGYREVTQPIERFAVFIFLALVALSMEILLSENQKARQVS